MAGNSALIFALHLCYNDLQSQHVKHEHAALFRCFITLFQAQLILFAAVRLCLHVKQLSAALKSVIYKRTLWLTLSLCLSSSSLSSALCPSKCCCVSHTTRSGRLMNQSVVGGGPLPHRNAKGGQYIQLSCHEPQQESTHCL